MTAPKAKTAAKPKAPAKDKEPEFKPTKDEAPQGWGVLRPGDRVHHYYRDGTSLCGRVGLYGGDLYPDPPLSNFEECSSCTTRLVALGVRS